MEPLLSQLSVLAWLPAESIRSRSAVGSDFPPEVLDVIKSWDTDCIIREDNSRLTTRAWNGYGINEKRGVY